MSPAVTFKELLSGLAAAHDHEVLSVRDECGVKMATLSKEYNHKVDCMVAEIQSLRTRLGEREEDGVDKHLPESALSSEGSKKDERTHSNKQEENHSQGCTSHRSLDTHLDEVYNAPPAAHVQHTLKPGWSRNAIWGTDHVTLPTHQDTTEDPVMHSMFVMSPFEGHTSGFFGCSRGVMFPFSPFRTLWDFASLTFILVDIMLLPYIFAFSPDPSWGLQAIENAGLMFWTCDMVQGPFLGYFIQGEYIDSRCRIVKHYLRSWFLVDLFVVMPEWLTVFLGDDNPVNALAGVGKIFKSIRVIRVLRLLRLPKTQRLIEHLYDMSKGEYTFLLLDVAQLIAFVMVFNHLIACAWYGIGENRREDGLTSWITAGNFESESKTYLYLTSLHWSLSQFTPGANRGRPTSADERLFNIVVLFFAMVVFSSFVGSITSHITRLRSMRLGTAKQLWLLRRFLREHEVNENLAVRIHKFIEHKLHKEHLKPRIQEIETLNKLSPALSDELSYDMHSKPFQAHPFFACLTAHMEVIMHRLCRTALQPHFAARDEHVFVAGDEGKHFYVVVAGELRYECLGRDSVLVSAENRTGDRFSIEWIAEAVLWTVWRHRGQLIVGPHTPSELLVVKPEVFFEVMCKHPRSWLYATVYGEHFIRYINQLPHLSDVIADEPFYLAAPRHAYQVASNPSESRAVGVIGRALPKNCRNDGEDAEIRTPPLLDVVIDKDTMCAEANGDLHCEEDDDDNDEDQGLDQDQDAGLVFAAEAREEEQREEEEIILHNL